MMKLWELNSIDKQALPLFVADVKPNFRIALLNMRRSIA